jgi:phosphate starvation-inducible protein PhoH
VRHPLVQEVVRAYEAYEAGKAQKAAGQRAAPPPSDPPSDG